MYEKQLNSEHIGFERMPLLPLPSPFMSEGFFKYLKLALFDPDPDPTYPVITDFIFQIISDPETIKNHCQVEKVLTVKGHQQNLRRFTASVPDL